VWRADCQALAEDIVRGEATETDSNFKHKERNRPSGR
jgi:hypothetical protein